MKNKKYNNYNSNSIDSEIKNELYDYEDKLSPKKFIKYITLFCITYYMISANISYIILNIKTNLLLREIIKFENKHKDDVESEILNFYDVNSKNLLLESDLKIKDFNLNYPDVSVILLIYNQANIIHTSIRSIQNQSLKSIEIIIIDDCSIDDSRNFIVFQL